jgi:hypothetical protein
LKAIGSSDLLAAASYRSSMTSQLMKDSHQSC